MSIKIRFFIAFCIVIFLIGGGLALLLNLHLRQPAFAARNLPDSDLSVVGAPTLPASTVDSIFARLGSPMAGTGALVERTARQVNIDDAFALAVWWTETNDGAAGVGLADRNPGSVRGSSGYPSAYDGYTIYPSYADAVVYWFHMLKNIYIGRGLTTVYSISHPYVGTSTSYLWAGKVVALMMRYRGEAPPPTPTVLSNLPLQNRHITRPVKTGVTTTQANVSSISARPAALARQPGFSLSTTATWLIAICALLLALAIALSVRVLPAFLRISKRHAMEPDAMNRVPTSESFSEPTTDALHALPAFQSPIFRLPSRSLNEPQTGALVGTRLIASAHIATVSTAPIPAVAAPATSAPAASLSAGSQLRRIQLRPESPATDRLQEMPVPAGGRPTGLLARYGNNVPERG